VPATITSAELSPREEASLRRLGELAETSGPLIAGPWQSEVGFEVLYWIPFLRWATRTAGISPDRVTAVSRGGAAPWYKGIAGQYVDILEAFAPEAFRSLTDERWATNRGQKQNEFGDWDAAVLDKLADRVSWSHAQLLHPSLMYRLFQRFWRGRAPLSHVLEHVAYERLEAPSLDVLETELPEDYVAAKFYFRPSFPDTPGNRELAHGIVARLAGVSDVVLLNTGLELDDHAELDIDGRHVIRALQGIPAERNLEAQSAIIARARAYVGTYGGLSYLAPFYGVPSIAVYSNDEHFLLSHVDTARRAAAEMSTSITLVDARALDLARVLPMVDAA
jgi:hypothetical protein